MRAYLLTALLLLPWDGAQSASNGDIDAYAKKIEGPLKKARYMERDCTPTKMAGWNGFNTVRCSYAVTDKTTGQVKPGLVILLDPSASTLSAWILNACETVRPAEQISSCSNRLFQAVLANSGGQFAVAGIVYEDLIPKDGLYEAYGFHNGVTVLLKGVEHRRTKAFSGAELEAALCATPERTASQAGYGRIVGVTRDEYLKFKPGTDVVGLKWPAVVSGEHKKAMNGQQNSLLDAWLAANDP